MEVKEYQPLSAEEAYNPERFLKSFGRVKAFGKLEDILVNRKRFRYITKMQISI